MLGLSVVLRLLPLLGPDMQRLSGSRIESVESVCRELLSQHRAVGNNTFVVVDECHPVNPTYRIDPEDSIYIVGLEQSPELVPCIVWAHGVFDRMTQMVERVRFFQLFL